jgi:hypothetical protein
VGSRPYGSSVWDRKPGAIMSCSPSAIGGAGPNHHLRQCLVFLKVPIMQQPEAYVGRADKLFDQRGSLENDDTREFPAGVHGRVYDMDCRHQYPFGGSMNGRRDATRRIDSVSAGDRRIHTCAFLSGTRLQSQVFYSFVTVGRASKSARSTPDRGQMTSII